ncbi:hypothetical protein [Paraburkholderia ginsengisoli]|uniref:Uncharacterized protein n=1 Tax=Paraburkholderia ginsengisoli TaxID=311231 RepID=A0A7T4N3T5_9BURK|nr:hypothetical protein [Paraburkholderia ginsengisoli]QQC64717.1 hypothetical protein I6I06_04365 [Paraburkholderia ginsengisoli]
MHDRESRAGSLRRTPASPVAAGQIVMRDLRAGSSIVAVEGDLQLGFRDRSLAWLSDAVPLTSIILREGECCVTPQHGIVSISSAHANAAAFIVLPSHAGASVYGRMREAAQHLAGLVRTRLRRTA